MRNFRLKAMHLYLVLVCVITSCSTDVKKSETTKRVKLLEDGHYDIIQVDGCQYISNDIYGGITHLVTCPNAH